MANALAHRQRRLVHTFELHEACDLAHITFRRKVETYFAPGVHELRATLGAARRVAPQTATQNRMVCRLAHFVAKWKPTLRREYTSYAQRSGRPIALRRKQLPRTEWCAVAEHS